LIKWHSSRDGTALSHKQWNVMANSGCSGQSCGFSWPERHYTHTHLLRHEQADTIHDSCLTGGLKKISSLSFLLHILKVSFQIIIKFTIALFPSTYSFFYVLLIFDFKAYPHCSCFNRPTSFEPLYHQ
jgi:hypothetical protein